MSAAPDLKTMRSIVAEYSDVLLAGIDMYKIDGGKTVTLDDIRGELKCSSA